MVLERLARLSVDVSLLPEVEGLWVPVMRIGNIGQVPTLEVAARPLSAMQAGLKRAEDLLLATTSLLILLPVLVLIAISIKLDSAGPICYRQQRAGFHDRTFWVWKFRTMRHAPETGGPLRQTSRSDARVTTVGWFLRKTSLVVAAAVQCDPRQDVCGRAATARGDDDHGGSAPARSPGKVQSSPPCKARHHRMGTSQWQPGRDR